MYQNDIENPTFLTKCKIVINQANYLLIFIIPLLITFCINFLIQYRLYTRGKSILETIALIVLIAFILICLIRFTLNKNMFFIWASCLLLVFFIREIHPPGSSLGVYLGILGLFYVALNKHNLYVGYFQDKTLINLIAMGFFTYLISVTIDQRWWRFIPGEELANVPLEETLEVVGHLLIGYGFAFASNIRQNSI